MGKPHRIAAGGIIFKDNTVLLVRYCDTAGDGTYLVGPGGALEDDENVIQAIIREVKEETNITVKPIRVVAIEDLMCSRYKMDKIWMVCEFVEGEVRKTKEAKEEGIIEAGWFAHDQLSNEIVFPSLLMQHDWEQLQTGTWQVECLPSREANF